MTCCVQARSHSRRRPVDAASAYLAIGVDLKGRKHALGCWIRDGEGSFGRSSSTCATTRGYGAASFST